jgi:Chitin synthase export chaperone
MIIVNFWILLLNGFVGFQWTEDGTALSIWTFRITSAALFGVMYFITLGTFKNLGFLRAGSPYILYFSYYLFPLACFLIYVILQIILVLSTMEDLWPLGRHHTSSLTCLILILIFSIRGHLFWGDIFRRCTESSLVWQCSSMSTLSALFGWHVFFVSFQLTCRHDGL